MDTMLFGTGPAILNFMANLQTILYRTVNCKQLLQNVGSHSLYIAAKKSGT